MTEAIAALGLNTGSTVTQSDKKRINVAGRTIDVVPAWRCLLEFRNQRDSRPREPKEDFYENGILILELASGRKESIVYTK